MKMKIWYCSMVGLGALITAGAAWAQVVIDPPTPKAYFPARVTISTTAFTDMDGRTDSFDPAQTTVLMAGNKITVSPLMTGAGNFPESIPENFDQTIGALPPGTYVVEVVRRATGRGTAGPLGTPVTFTVAPRGVTEPLMNYTDIWWDQDESGWGMGLYHHASNQLFGTMFVYGSDGKPTWYTITDGFFTSPNDFQGMLYKTQGPYFGGAFDPSKVSVMPAGSASIEFNSQDSNFATIIFVIEGVRFVKVIERQPF